MSAKKPDAVEAGGACKRLASELLQDPTKANNASRLAAALKASTPEEDLSQAIRGLKLYFLSGFDKHGLRTNRPPQEESANAEGIFQAWLHRQYISAHAKLLALMQDPATPAAAQVEALIAIMEFVRGESVGRFHGGLFTAMIATMLRSAAFSETFLGAFANKFLKFADVRFYCLQAIGQVCNVLSANSATAEDVEDEDEEVEEAERGEPKGPSNDTLSASDIARNCFDLLCVVPESLGPRTANLARKDQLLLKAMQEGTGEDPATPKLLSWCGAVENNLVQAAPGNSESSRKRRKRKCTEGLKGNGAVEARQWANPKLQKKAYSSAWLAFLQMALPDDLYKKVLTKIHTTVLPNMSDPLLLCDFMTATLNKGGLVAMLALNGIFVLVTKHGLEYPHFYRRLYGLLKLEVFKAKHRVEFFKLVDIFLASSLVPAYTAAAFAKRFARLALFTTPAGAMVALGFIHNLIRRHPSCVVLLHRPNVTGNHAGKDPYIEDCDDPAQSHAIDSSLWEVETLKSHYYAAVAQMACVILEKDLTDRRKTAEINMGLLTKESYSSMISAELKKRVKRVPVAFYPKPPTKLFGEHCAEDFLGWSFDDSQEQS